MNETALGRFWELLGWVLALKSEAFAQINTLPNGSKVAIIVVLVAGLSQAAAHSIILFINRVKPNTLHFWHSYWGNFIRLWLLIFGCNYLGD